MPNDYYIHQPNGNTSLIELCDRDGNVLAEILPKGSPVHRQTVIDLFKLMASEVLEQYQP